MKLINEVESDKPEKIEAMFDEIKWMADQLRLNEWSVAAAT